MNRAASFLWATSVALVLSASPVFAGVLKVNFPNKINHNQGMGSDGTNYRAGSSSVPEQTITDKGGSNVVKFEPKGVKKVPKSAIKDALKTGLRGGAAAIAINAAVYAGLAGVQWIFDNSGLRKKVGGEEPISPDFYGWTPANGGFCGGKKFASSSAAHQCVVDEYGANVAPSGFVNPRKGKVEFISVAMYVVGVTVDYGGNALPDFYTTTVVQQGTCPATHHMTPDGMCVSGEPQYAPVTDPELDQFADNLIDNMSDEDLRSVYATLAEINPAIGMYFPDYLTAPDGTYEQAVSSPLQTTQIARVNADGSVSRLTRKEWADFKLTYSPNNTNVNYTPTKNVVVTNEQGQTVEEEKTTEEDAVEAPQLSTALETANQPLTDWATSITAGPSSMTAGVSYPLLFTYGGTCSLGTITLPYLNGYGLQPICTAINDYVKPILGVLFAAWTILHIFGIWRQTTQQVRPA